MKSVCVFGLGWLGKQLVESIVNKGVNVFGVNRSLKTDLKIIQYKYDLNNPDQSTIEILRTQEIDLLIITVPPSTSQDYSKNILNFLSFFDPIKTKVVFTSSTSVYGNSIGNIYENKEVNPLTNNARKIVEIEEVISKRFGGNGLIIRLAGLVGVKRHPVKFLSGKRDIVNPYAAVNLIHAEEITSFFNHLLNQWISGVVNLCNPDHPNRIDYYTNLAEKLKLPLPHFNIRDEFLGKRIFSNRMKELNFTFKYNKLENFPLPSI